MNIEFIKDIRLYDEEGYLIAIWNEYVPFQMKRVAECKRTEVHTEKNNNEF